MSGIVELDVHSNQRLINIDDGHGQFRYKDYRASSTPQTMTLGAPEFMRRSEARIEVAVLRLARGDLAGTSTHVAAAIDTLDAVVRSAGSDSEARRLLADACLAAADVAQRRHEPERARAFRERARDSLQPLVATLKDRRFQLAWARALLGVGRTQEAAAVVASLRSTGFRRDVLDALAPARVAPGESPRPIDTPSTVP